MLGIGAEITLSLNTPNDEYPKLLGTYGAPDLSISCPRRGYLHLEDLRVGQIIEAGEILGHLSETDGELQQLEISRSREELEVYIKAQVLRDSIAHDLDQLQQEFERLKASARAEEIEEARKRAKAHISSLNISLEQVERSVSAGLSSTSELAKLKGESAELKAALSPLRAQLRYWRALVDQAKPLETTTLQQAQQEESQRLEIAQKYETLSRATQAKIDTLRAPEQVMITEMIARSGSMCQAGDLLIKLQPTEEVAYLWVVRGDGMKITQDRPLRLVPLRDGQLLPHLSRRAQIKEMGQTLTTIPPQLAQVIAPQMGLGIHFNQFRQAQWGLPVIVTLDEPWRGLLPFGTLVSVEP